jgi:CheY-like chemotaxis protein
MDRLFNSLLDISRLDAGTLSPNLRAFPIERLFAQLSAEYGEAAARQNLWLRFHAGGAVVVSDEVMLHRILSNLVSNAIRNTHAGGVLVACRARAGEFQIEVRDSGIGIAEEKHRDIFLEFYRIGDAGGNGAMGLGLGLAIVARLAGLLGTEVQVRSAPGRGSTFSLRLPRGRVEALVAPSDPVRPAFGQPDIGLRVLVIDDDPLVLAGNRALLEELGCEVTSAADATQAHAALAALAATPLLVLCDLWLANGENGIDLLRQLTALTTAPISGILVSGDTGVEAQAAADRAGYLLLHKPVSPAKLRAVVMSFVVKVQKMTGAGQAAQ